ncbi:S1 family peptidase [Pseudobacteriovorax antillogorgiicola]|nr:trypsin-like serine protease [Pseudobacteriovorax antillogorgiicola]
MIMNSAWKAAVIASALVLGACGSEQQNSGLDIINGSIPSDDGLIEQSTVALVSSNGSVFCTGTLVSSRHVISAAHCLQGFGGTLYIGFGRNSSEFTYVRASDYTTNPNYTGSFAKSVPGDISIVELSESAPSKYNPVSIYKGSISGQTVYLAGFGQTESGGSGQLYYTSVGVSSTTSNELTVYENGTGACYGDSGGPAYVYTNGELQVVGATSRGQTGCRGSSVYTYIPYFLSWIEGWTGLNL